MGTNEKKLIVVAGATGNQGGAVARKLIESGKWQVRGLTRDPDSELLYKCTDFYAPDCDGAVRFDDPTIGIDWGIDSQTAILSDKDAKAQTFASFVSPFKYEVRS